MKQEFILEGLGCANCAAKIEAEVNKLDEVHSATVDFVSKRLIVESVVNFADNFEKIEAIVKKIEPEISIVFKSKQANRIVAKTVIDDEHDHRKQWIKLILGGAIFAIGLLFRFPNWLELVIFLASYIIVGENVVISAVKGITRGQVFTEHFLMSVATIGAFCIGEYPEGVAVMLFYLVGEMFQDMAVDHSRKSISALMDIRPDYANLKTGNDIIRVSPEDVSIGDIIVVKPGERIPLDGKVIDGSSMVDTSTLTGESIPRELEVGMDALSGFINKNGVLTIAVSKDFGESTVSKILDLVQNAGSRKAPTEKFITKFARYYTPVVVFGALALAVFPPLLIPGALFSDWIYRALVFLVVSCPCALVISIPLGFFGGIGGASKRGILIKGANYLEALNNVNSVVFDKTGTLTKGIFEVTEVSPQNGFSSKELLRFAAFAESFSNHPIAVSIMNASKEDVDQSRISNYTELAGQGISVKIDGKEVIAGNSRLMELRNIQFNDIESIGTVVHIAVENKYAGCIVISDAIKEDAKHAIDELKKLGVGQTIILTGDLKSVGEKIGAQLGVDTVYAELLPADKVAKLEALEAEKTNKGNIIFVGDGINDAPVLARADVGIAMGGLGSDAAIEAADIVIMTDEPSKIATAIRIARRTRTIVFQNIIFALGIKAIFLVLGALGLASMWEAVFADMGVAILAILNASRVMTTKNL